MNFFKLVFALCKAQHPLGGMELQKKRSTKRLQHAGNLFRKSLQVKDLKPFRSKVKGTHSIG